MPDLGCIELRTCIWAHCFTHGDAENPFAAIDPGITGWVRGIQRTGHLEQQQSSRDNDVAVRIVLQIVGIDVVQGDCVAVTQINHCVVANLSCTRGNLRRG